MILQSFAVRNTPIIIEQPEACHLPACLLSVIILPLYMPAECLVKYIMVTVTPSGKWA